MTIVQQLEALVGTIQFNLPYLLSLLAIIWGIQLVNFALQYKLNILGILPRHPLGLFGVIFAPVLHGGFAHLFFNSIPLFILANFVMLQGQFAFIEITLLITVLSGLAVWLIGRKALHVGASGLIMGYWGYLAVNAFINPSIISAFLVVICLYYFGGFISSLIPSDESTSWESHVMGLIAGVCVEYFHLVDWVNGVFHLYAT